MIPNNMDAILSVNQTGTTYTGETSNTFYMEPSVLRVTVQGCRSLFLAPLLRHGSKMLGTDSLPWVRP